MARECSLSTIAKEYIMASYNSRIQIVTIWILDIAAMARECSLSTLVSEYTRTNNDYRIDCHKMDIGRSCHG